MEDLSYEHTFTATAGEPCSMILINSRSKDFKIKVKGNNVATYIMAVDFPSKTHLSSLTSVYRGSKDDNIVFVYVGSTLHMATEATISY